MKYREVITYKDYFQKKMQKMPTKEIDRAVRIMNDYFNDKNGDR